jgi:hypothetical protein
MHPHLASAASGSESYMPCLCCIRAMVLHRFWSKRRHRTSMCYNGSSQQQAVPMTSSMRRQPHVAGPPTYACTRTLLPPQVDESNTVAADQQRRGCACRERHSQPAEVSWALPAVARVACQCASIFMPVAPKLHQLIVGVSSSPCSNNRLVVQPHTALHHICAVWQQQLPSQLGSTALAPQHAYHGFKRFLLTLC